VTSPGWPERAVSDPAGLITDLVAAAEHRLTREQVEVVVTAVAGGRAKSRRLASALAGRPGVLADGRSPAPRVVGDLLIAMRQAAADLPAQRPGLVLLSVRAAGRAVRGVREDQAGLFPGQGRAAAVRQVPGHRRPGPGNRDLRHHR
jgi:hypothetical protein